FYADKVTDSMRKTMDETNRRRAIQMKYNEENGITPTTVSRTREEILNQSSILDIRGKKAYVEPTEVNIAADPVVEYMDRNGIEKLILETEKKMKAAAKDLDFIQAAQHRDEMYALKKLLERK
ncbi:MAG TPA: UvrB/UvrC motif-containing protein, partial [Saprospiraceae bacterium]|nr:UvrB/UvrC motif-containing protein [Saprospiraceae bacterium]